jgi:hypothetical protein
MERRRLGLLEATETGKYIRIHISPQQAGFIGVPYWKTTESHDFITIVSWLISTTAYLVPRMQHPNIIF